MESNELIIALQKQIADMKEEADRRAKSELERITAEEAARKEEDNLRRRAEKLAYEEKIKAHEEAVRKQKEALEAEKKKAQDEAYALEMEKLHLQKQREEQGALIENLKSQIAEAEFQEEQNRKRIEDAKAIAANTSVPSEEQDKVNVENPEAPTNQGNAVQGTDGDTPSTPLMSVHLKHILRQAQRQY